MKPTVYIETTIIGHSTSRIPNDLVVAGQMVATRGWWTLSRDRFTLVASQLVRDEVARGDAEAAAERLALLEGIPLLPATPSVAALAQSLLDRHALPEKARADAVHLSIAATNGIDFLLTWNCKHLANAIMRQTIELVCRDAGFGCPIICTPYELGRYSHD